LLIAPSDKSFFITMDNPGVTFYENDNETYNTRYVGNFKFALPLSSKYCLLVVGSQKKIRFKRKHKKSINVRLVPDILINKINHHSAQVVNQYLVSHLR